MTGIKVSVVCCIAVVPLLKCNSLQSIIKVLSKITTRMII